MTPRRPLDPAVPFAVSYWAEVADWPLGEAVMGAFLSTHPMVVHHGRAGLFPMSPEQIDRERPGWTLRLIVRALEGLEDRNELVRGGGWFFVERVMCRATLSGPTQVQGVLDRVDMAPRNSDSWGAFMAAAFRRAPALYLALAADPRNRPPVVGHADGIETLLTRSESPEGKGSGDGMQTPSRPRPRLMEAPGGVRDTTELDEEDGQAAA